MDFDPYVLAKAAVLPPGLNAVVGLIGIALLPLARRAALVLIVAAVTTSWAFGMPLVAGWLASPLERAPVLDIAAIADRDVTAIVVLGGGQYQFAPEAGGDSEVSRTTLERLRYGARVHRATGLALVVSGGNPLGGARTEAELMQAALEDDFGVAVTWAEDESLNTAENALFVARELGKATVVLVTHAVHMPRARRAFEAAGLTVIPAPLGFVSGRGDGVAFTDLVPTRDGFLGSRYALYEYCGAIWYWWHYG